MKKAFALFMLLMGLTMMGTTSCSDDNNDVKEPEITRPDTTQTEKPDTARTDTIVNDAAQGWPANYGGVMLQAFYWDSFDDSQWSLLEQQADQLAGTFDLVWLPQSGNCGGQSMGYDDLYWFSNYNSSFGNEQQLRSLINTFRQKGIKTIADVVINHRRNLSNWVDFPKETYKGKTYEMLSTDIVRNDDGGKTLTWAQQNGFDLSKNNDSGEGWDGMRDIDHKSENVQTIVKAYLDFLKNDLGYSGFRYDMVKGYSASYTGLYNASAKPEFSVGECWDGTKTIKNWINGTATNGQPQSAAFDFQFRYAVRNAMNNGNYSRLNQQNDGNWPLISSYEENGKYRRYAVTFVENHDTERRRNAAQDPLLRDTLAANAYLLAMPGTPCVFLKHWMDCKRDIANMIAVRKAVGIHNQSTYTNMMVKADHYAVQTDGSRGSLLCVVGTKASDYQPTQGSWKKAIEGYHYVYYVSGIDPATINFPDIKEEEKPQVEIPSFCTVAEGEVCAFFEAPASWTQPIMCWAWTDSPADNFTSATGTWPGIVCQQIGTAPNGKAVWKWTWDGTKQNNTSATMPAKIIFSNSGAPQTDDLPFQNGGYYTKEHGLFGTVSSR